VIRLEDCELVEMRSADDEAAFFARMGRFFASAKVRRECGGYPLNDGPSYRWFVVRLKGQTRVLGFISIEHQLDIVRIREGYLRPEARGRGLFRALRDHVLGYVDEFDLACTTRVPEACVRFLAPHGFQVRATRGHWVTLVRNAHAGRDGSREAGRGPVRRTGRFAAGETGGRHQPDPPMPA